MAITLNIEAAADLRSFDRVADSASKRFADAGQKAGQAFSSGMDSAMSKADPKSVAAWERSYDKLLDSIGRVRAEQAKLDDLRARGASDSRIISQAEALERARRAEARATRDAGDAYEGLSSRAGRAFGVLSDLSSGTRLGGVISDAEMLAGRFGGVGIAVGATVTAVAGLAVGVGAASSALYQLGSMWDSVADGITARTGKVGDELRSLTDQVERIGRESSTGIGQLGDIVGQVDAAIGGTGDQVGNLALYLGDLNKVTREQTNVRQLGQLYRVFRIEAEDQIPVLNSLYDVFSKTGIPVNELIGLMAGAGSEAQQAGLSFDEFRSMVVGFTRAGVPAENAVTGLQKALAKVAKDGGDPADALTRTIDKIRELQAAGNDPLARQVAEDFFGSKNFDEFITAIETGKLKTEQFSESLSTNLRENQVDIRDVQEATEDAGEKFDRLTNRLELRFKPVAEKAFGAVNDFLGSILDSLDAIDARDWGGFWEIFNRPLGGPWSGGGSSGDDWLGGGVDNLDGGGTTVRGTPGRGLPMPWKLPAAPADMHGSHGQIGTLAQMASSMGLSFASGADNHPMDSGFHPSGQAGDFSNQRAHGPNTPEMDRFAEAMLNYAPYIRELIYSGASQNIYKGNLVPAIDQPGSPYNTGQAGYHGDHVHIAIEDSMAAAFRAAIAQGPTAATRTSGMSSWGPNDDRRVRDSGERIADVQDSIAKADRRIADIKEQIADMEKERLAAATERLHAEKAALDAQREADLTAGTTLGKEKSKTAQDAKKAAERAAEAEQRVTERKQQLKERDLVDAEAARDRLQNRDLRNAREAYADAQRGTSQPSSSRGGGFSMAARNPIGAPLAADFGFSGGLAGVAENLTNFLGNMAFAPMLGALSAQQVAGDPYGMTRGAGGLIGMAAMGGGMGGPGMSNIFGGPLGAAPGPAPTTVGGSAPTSIGGAGFGGLGGLAMSGIQAGIGAAGMALDGIAPGAGMAASMAANMGIQLTNRTIAQLGKTAAIGVGGLLESFSLADPGQSWFGRVAGAFAGAKPALPNMAGGPANPASSQQGGGGQQGAPITVNYTNNQATEDRAGKDLTNHLTAMNAAPGW